MSLIENDPLQFYWSMDPAHILLTTAFLGPGMLWFIELYRNFKDRHELTRPPYGLAIFRWRAVCVGDLFALPQALTIIARYYARMGVEPSFWTSSSFFVIPLILGFAASAGFIITEEVGKTYPKGKKVSLTRAYHFLYFWWMSYMLLAFVIRWFVYREELTMLIFAAVAFSLWVLEVIKDGRDLNPAWRHVVHKYPKRHAYL